MMAALKQRSCFKGLEESGEKGLVYWKAFMVFPDA